MKFGEILRKFGKKHAKNTQKEFVQNANSDLKLQPDTTQPTDFKSHLKVTSDISNLREQAEQAENDLKTFLNLNSQLAAKARANSLGKSRSFDGLYADLIKRAEEMEIEEMAKCGVNKDGYLLLKEVEQLLKSAQNDTDYTNCDKAEDLLASFLKNNPDLAKSIDLDKGLNDGLNALEKKLYDLSALIDETHQNITSNQKTAKYGYENSSR